MCGAIHSLPQYAFTASCSVKAQGQLYLYLKLDLVAVQEVGWDEGGTQSADDYAFYGNENADHHLGT
jgi:hypothetical protein